MKNESVDADGLWIVSLACTDHFVPHHVSSSQTLAFASRTLLRTFCINTNINCKNGFLPFFKTGFNFECKWIFRLSRCHKSIQSHWRLWYEPMVNDDVRLKQSRHRMEKLYSSEKFGWGRVGSFRDWANFYYSQGTIWGSWCCWTCYKIWAKTRNLTCQLRTKTFVDMHKQNRKLNFKKWTSISSKG